MLTLLKLLALSSLISLGHTRVSRSIFKLIVGGEGVFLGGEVVKRAEGAWEDEGPIIYVLLGGYDTMGIGYMA